MKCVQEKCFLPVVDIGSNLGLPREAEVLLLLINPSTVSGGPEDQLARTITSFGLTWRESQEHKASERKTGLSLGCLCRAKAADPTCQVWPSTPGCHRDSQLWNILI